MTHNEMVRRVVEARMNRMNREQCRKALRNYMITDYGECDMEELFEFYQQYAPR